MGSGSLRRNQSAKSKKGDDREYPARREMVFRRQDFGLGRLKRLALVDFPYDVFARIEAAASKLGITLERFINHAIRNFIKSQKSWRAA